MRIFKVPFDVKREEKIFGGYLSLRQVLYIMLAVSTLIIFTIPISIIIKVLFVAILGIFFLLCAFLKLNEQNFDKLFFYFVKFVFRKRNYIYERSKF